MKRPIETIDLLEIQVSFTSLWSHFGPLVADL
jgi:hypothetical protein